MIQKETFEESAIRRFVQIKLRSFLKKDDASEQLKAVEALTAFAESKKILEGVSQLEDAFIALGEEIMPSSAELGNRVMEHAVAFLREQRIPLSQGQDALEITKTGQETLEKSARTELVRQKLGLSQ